MNHFRFPKKDMQESMELAAPNALSASSVAGIMVENEILSDDEDEDVAQRGEEEEEEGEENVLGIRLAHASGGEGDFREVEDVKQANGGYSCYALLCVVAVTWDVVDIDADGGAS